MTIKSGTMSFFALANNLGTFASNVNFSWL